MMRYAFALFGLLSLLSNVLAQDWNFLVTYSPPGSKFISYTGNMVAPTLPRAGVYYLWPGLQPTDNSGVFQPVLDGRSGGWWFGSGWCCSNPSLPWGGGFPANGRDVLGFNYTLDAGANTWRSELTNRRTKEIAKNDFPLADKDFNQAIMAIERYDVPWDFGPLQFNTIKIVATGTDSGWCAQNSFNNYNEATKFTMTPPRAVVGENTVTCIIDKVILTGPA